MSKIPIEVCDLVNDYNVADGDQVFPAATPESPNEYLEVNRANKFGVQLVWADITSSGALNGVVTLQSSIDGITWDDLTYDDGTVIEIDIDSIAGSESIEYPLGLQALYFRADFEVNLLTGGELSIHSTWRVN